MMKSYPLQTSLYLRIDTKTWLRDSHGLFDYESKQVEVNSLAEHTDTYIVRVNSQVLTTRDLTAYQHIRDFSLLAAIEPVQNGFLLKPCQDRESVWLITRDLGEAGFNISPGDVLRFGRMKFVTYLDDDQDCRPTDSPQTEASEEPSEVHSQRECRICFGDDEDALNPLISPCACTGSLKFIHYQCLKRWLETTMITRETDHYKYVYWKSLDCELCKTSFPLIYNDGRGRYPLCEVGKGDSPYIVLSSLHSDLHKKQATAITLNRNCSVNIGRGHDSEIRLNDASISRLHARLYNRDGLFYIEDSRSKFGTSVQITQPLLIDKCPVSVQIGRTVMRLEVHTSDLKQKPWFEEYFDEDCFPSPA
jgi:hypothetical protein